MNEFLLLNKAEKIVLSRHAKDRLIERGILINDVIVCIQTGEKITDYFDDKPLPSCLVLGKSLAGKSLHIVISTDHDFIYLITAYYPDPLLWSDDYRVRKGRLI